MRRDKTNPGGIDAHPGNGFEARPHPAVAGTPDELARFVASGNARWSKVVKQTGAQVD